MQTEYFTPIAESIARLISDIQGGGHHPFYRFDNFGTDEKLIPLERYSDTEISWHRPGDTQARITLWDIIPADLIDIKLHNPVVLRREQKASATVSIDNRSGLTDQKYTWTKEFKEGEQELDAIKSGFEVSSSTTFGTGDASPVKGEQTFETKVTNEWEKQTGRSKETTTGGDYPLVALSKTHVRGYLRWEEQDLRRHIEAKGTFEFKIRAGKFSYGKRKGRRRKKWHWSGTRTWDSLESLILTAQQRGSVDWEAYHWFRRNPAPQHKIDALKLYPRSPFDQFIEYKGADGIEVVTETLADLR